MKESTSVLFGGRPTAPQVRHLVEKFGDRGEGDTITYEEIGSTIGEDVKSNRFRTVMNAWRKALRKENNIEAENVRNVGVRFLRPGERLRLGVKTIGQGIRRFGKGTKQLGDVPGERLDSDSDRNALIKVKRVAEVLYAEARAELTKVKVYLSPTKTIPRIGPPGA